jgi:hypothetical protein
LNGLEDLSPYKSDIKSSGAKNSPHPARRKNQNSSKDNPENFGYPNSKLKSIKDKVTLLK